MSALKPGLTALVLVVGLAGSAPAQMVGRGHSYNGGYGGYNGNPGFNANSAYYGNQGFGNYGLPGAYPGYGFAGYSAYGPGTAFNGYRYPMANTAPRTYNNLGGLTGAIRTQTGAGTSYRGGNDGVPGRRRVR